MRKWIEGSVDRENDHIQIRYNEEKSPIALVSNQSGNIIVQFLVVSKDKQKAKEEVVRELDYYFSELDKEAPWAYAIYHCGTASNLYSTVHWGYYTKGYKDKNNAV